MMPLHYMRCCLLNHPSVTRSCLWRRRELAPRREGGTWRCGWGLGQGSGEREAEGRELGREEKERVRESEGERESIAWLGYQGRQESVSQSVSVCYPHLTD